MILLNSEKKPNKQTKQQKNNKKHKKQPPPKNFVSKVKALKTLIFFRHVQIVLQN
jgi:hypothetical protein